MDTELNYYLPEETLALQRLNDIKRDCYAKLLRLRQAARALDVTIRLGQQAAREQLTYSDLPDQLDGTFNKMVNATSQQARGIQNSIERCEMRIAETTRSLAVVQRKAHMRNERSAESWERIQSEIEEFTQMTVLASESD
jgi:hypothetical protein